MTTFVSSPASSSQNGRVIAQLPMLLTGPSPRLIESTDPIGPRTNDALVRKTIDDLEKGVHRVNMASTEQVSRVKELDVVVAILQSVRRDGPTGWGGQVAKGYLGITFPKEFKDSSNPNLVAAEHYALAKYEVFGKLHSKFMMDRMIEGYNAKKSIFFMVGAERAMRFDENVPTSPPSSDSVRWAKMGAADGAKLLQPKQPR